MRWRTLSMRGWAVVVGAGAVVIALAALMVTQIPHRAPDGRDGVVSRGETGTLDEHDAVFSGFVGEKRTRVEAKEQDWLTRALGEDSISAADRARVVEALRSAVDDPDALLTLSETQMLLDTIASHAAARSSPSPESYLAICEAESSLYEWIPWQDNSGMHTFLDYWRISYDDSTSPEEAMSLVWGRFMDEAGDRFEALGQPPEGARIVVRKVRTEDQAEDQFFRDIDEQQYWSSELMTTAAQAFRRPSASLRDVLARRPGAVVAQCMVLVRMANGYPINWVTSWFQDPETGQWVCRTMVYKRARLTALVF